MEGIPVIKVAASVKVEMPQQQEKALSVGLSELTQSSIKLYYVTMGVKDIE